MAIIKPKRSTTPSTVPTTATLTDGELAINIPDRKIFIRSGDDVVELTSSGGTVIVDVFTEDGVWTKPNGCTKVDVILIGGGGGGGSGRKGSGLPANSGGGGGGGGGRTEETFLASTLPSTVSVTIGQGGLGAPAITTDDTDGAAGAAGTYTFFGLHAGGGAGGGGGGGRSGASGTAGSRGSGSRAQGGVGGLAQTARGQSPVRDHYAVPTGGGGGASSSNINNAAGDGGSTPYFYGPAEFAAAGAVVGESGQDGGSYYPQHLWGTGGAGGASGSLDSAVHAGKGGDGGLYGAGGGGGGAGSSGFSNSGAGGDGAPGIAVVISYCEAITPSLLPIVPITQADYDNLSPPDAGTLYVIVNGPAGGAGAQWLEVTQAQYDALDPPDPGTLYIVID